MARAADLVAQGVAAQQAFEAVIAGFDASKWDQKPAETEWSMRELFKHFAANTQGHVVEIKAILEGTPGFSRAAAPWNASRDAALDAGFDAAVAWMRQDCADYVGYLQALTDDALPQGGATGHGSMTVERLLVHFAHHGEEHAEQARKIREAVGA